jgi:signal transduction histidine kinase
VASTGLLEMRERALMLGGKLKIQSTPGTGTLITVEIPLASDKKDSDIKKRMTCVNLEKKS